MPKISTEKLNVHGMTCVSCERRIENILNDERGIFKCKSSYSKGSVKVTYDNESIGLTTIIEIIENLDYKIVDKKNPIEKNDNYLKYAGIGIIIISLYIIIDRVGGFTIFNKFPEAREGMGYSMLFFIGLLTSIHCVAMCGGINLSQSVTLELAGENKKKKIDSLIPSIKYNLGRVISYTVVGGIVGALGQVVSFSGKTQGIVAIIAGIFMVIMGINMINIFPWLRRLNISLPRIFSSKNGKGNNSPLYVGLLNGLMPCGPLQAMQLFALSTASPVKGALSMFFFSIGTVPLMFGLGALSSILTKKFKSNMTAISGVLVAILGITMFSSGMNLAGLNILSGPKDNVNNSVATIENGVQTITTNLSSGSYEPIVLQKGVSTKWVIVASKENINGCNNKVINQKFNFQKKLIEGENIIEFTPDENGTFVYSCWMGMIKSTITVVENINNY